MSIANKALEKLHLSYIECVNKKMDEFSTVENSRAAREKEWCVPEKSDYLSYMHNNFPVEYDNLVRLESNNY